MEDKLSAIAQEERSSTGAGGAAVVSPLKVFVLTMGCAKNEVDSSRMVEKLLPEFRENMEKEQAAKNLDLMVMLFTDVMGKGSYFVFYGQLAYVMKDIIETVFDEHTGFDPGIISRKQQMMPKLSELIKNIQ